MINTITKDIHFVFNKNRRVIAALLDFYRGRTTSFPYSVEDLKRTKQWLAKRDFVHNKDIILERLNIMEVMLKSKSTS